MVLFLHTVIESKIEHCFWRYFSTRSSPTCACWHRCSISVPRRPVRVRLLVPRYGKGANVVPTTCELFGRVTLNAARTVTALLGGRADQVLTRFPFLCGASVTYATCALFCCPAPRLCVRMRFVLSRAAVMTTVYVCVRHPSRGCLYLFCTAAVTAFYIVPDQNRDYVSLLPRTMGVDLRFPLDGIVPLAGCIGQ